MDVASLGFRTDLAVLALGGSLVEHRDRHAIDLYRALGLDDTESQVKLTRRPGVNGS